MSNEEPIEDLDRVLEVLSKPISRYILSILAGVYPGLYSGELDENENSHKND